MQSLPPYFFIKTKSIYDSIFLGVGQIEDVRRVVSIAVVGVFVEGRGFFLFLIIPTKEIYCYLFDASLAKPTPSQERSIFFQDFKKLGGCVNRYRKLLEISVIGPYRNIFLKSQRRQMNIIGIPVF